MTEVDEPAKAGIKESGNKRSDPKNYSEGRKSGKRINSSMGRGEPSVAQRKF